MKAGLPVIVTPLLDLQRLVESYRCGWVAPEDDSAFSAMLMQIDEPSVTRMRVPVSRAAAELSWEKERARLIQAYRDHGFA